MGIRNIVDETDETLRKKSREVTNFDKRLQTLIDDLADTLRKAAGAGLAAPQVGVLRRVCIVHATDDEKVKPIILVNPKIISQEGEQEGPEGCLSVPGKTGIVKRPQSVTVWARDRNGKEFTVIAEGFEARAMCHEIDHLDGQLYIDIMERFMTQEEIEEMEQGSWQLRKG